MKIDKMKTSSPCGNNPAPKHFENLQENKKVNCPCYTQCRQELQELLFELKSVTKNINIPKDGTNCDMNQTSGKSATYFRRSYKKP